MKKIFVFGFVFFQLVFPSCSNSGGDLSRREAMKKLQDSQSYRRNMEVKLLIKREYVFNVIGRYGYIKWSIMESKLTL
jgi:hypothetical protein